MTTRHTLTLTVFAVALMVSATPVTAHARRPVAPFDLTAHALSTSEVSVAWNDGNIDVTSFVVERSMQPKRGFRKVAVVDGGSHVLRDGALMNSTTYYYRVQTMQGKHKSRRSPSIGVTTMDAQPVAPTKTATQTPVRTATPVATSTPVPTVTATVTMNPTRTATKTPTRTPTVTATHTPVPTVTVTTSPSPTPDALAPTTPGNLHAAANGCTQVALSWSASTDGGGSGLDGYNLYRNGTFMKRVAAPSTATSDVGLAGSTTYAYAIAAVDCAGNVSGMSSTASATTPSCNQPPVANAGPDRSADVGAAVVFDGSQSHDADGSIASYAWTFGDGATGSGATATHSYATAGAYTVTLTVTDNAGATASDTAAVTVATAGSGGAVLWRQARGGTGFEVGHGTAVDGSGNVLVAGTFGDTADFGGGAMHSAGAGDVFLAKYTAAGAPVWSKRFGGTGTDIAYGVAVDRSANCDGAGGTNCVVVAGLFSATVDFGGGPLTSAGAFDGFVAKYSAAGAHVWSKRFGNVSDDVAYGVAVDAAGNTLVTGFFTNNADFGGGTLYSQYYDQDVFVAKYSPAGAHLWSRNFWSTSTDIAQAVAVDANGDVAVTGFFTGAIDAGLGMLRARRDDIFVAKLGGGDGHAIWAKGFGGIDVDRATGVAFDHSGNVLVTGLMYNDSVDFGGGPLTTGYDQDGFLVKLTGAAGAHVWSTRLGGAGNDGGSSVTADASDNVTVTGYFQGTVDFGGKVLTSAGASSADIFVVSYAPAGSVRWAQDFGGANGDGWQGGAVTTDAGTNEVVLTSSFEGTADFGGATLTSAGSDDVCVVKLHR